jgi:hypothetical protein
MATLRHILNGVTLDCELPVETDEEPVGEEQQMAGGNTRFWHRADKIQVVLQRRGVSEATLATWKSASPRNTALTYTDELNQSFTVRVIRRRFRLVRTIPATGAAFYDVAVEIKEL